MGSFSHFSTGSDVYDIHFSASVARKLGANSSVAGAAAVLTFMHSGEVGNGVRCCWHAPSLPTVPLFPGLAPATPSALNLFCRAAISNLRVCVAVDGQGRVSCRMHGSPQILLFLSQILLPGSTCIGSSFPRPQCFRS